MTWSKKEGARVLGSRLATEAGGFFSSKF